MHHNTATWSYIVCEDAERACVLAFATARHIAGTLFKGHRGRLAPELHTSVSVDHVVDIEPDDDDIVAEGPSLTLILSFSKKSLWMSPR